MNENQAVADAVQWSMRSTASESSGDDLTRVFLPTVESTKLGPIERSGFWTLVFSADHYSVKLK